MTSTFTRRFILGTATLALTAAVSMGSVQAATKLKWAHVYEPEHPYHKAAVWAAEQVKAKSDGRIQINVFPSSSLGKEVEINEGLNIGSVDMIYTGAAFAERFYGPTSISNYPFMIRDYDHWKKYRDSDLFKEIQAGFKNATGNEIVALSYYGQRHVTANKKIEKPADMKNLKIRVPNAPLFMMFPKAVGANATPMAFSEVYLALQQGVVDAQENPLLTIKMKKFYEVQSDIALTGHITISSLTIMSKLLKNKVSDADYKMIAQAAKDASYRASAASNKAEQELGAWLEGKGVTITPVDKKAFQDAVAPLLSGKDLPFTPEQAKRLKEL